MYIIYVYLQCFHVWVVYVLIFVESTGSLFVLFLKIKKFMFVFQEEMEYAEEILKSLKTAEQSNSRCAATR